MSDDDGDALANLYLPGSGDQPAWSAGPAGAGPPRPALPQPAPVEEGFRGQLLPGGPVVPPSPTGPAVVFRVDPDQAEGLASALDAAADRVQALITRAEQLSSVTPGAADAVSLSAAGRIALWPDADDGALMPALRGYHEQLRGSAAGYRQQLADYRRNEELNAQDLSGIGPEGLS